MNNTNLQSEIQRDLKRLELLPYVSRASANKRAYDAIPYFKTQSNSAKYGPLKFSSDDSSVKLQTQQVEWIFEWNPEVNNPEEAVEFVIERQKPAVDWNEIFQSLVELHCATPFEYDWRSRALTKVIDMFTEDALPDAMAIMNAELNGLDYPFQTVQLGQAGGVKFVHKNKLFKLIGRKTITEIYDGDYVAAMKVPQREISSINFLLSLNKPGLHLPLTVIVSYGCFAVVVSALIPIDKTTIVYGSNDGGSTVHDDSEPFRQMMEEIGTLLNLKKHEIKSSGKWLYTAGDVEGHVGHDYRNYLIDVARLSPSMVPSVHRSQEWLYHLFKPQYVAQLHTSLCADAFSSFDNLAVAESHQIEILNATKHLANVIIPQLATELDNDTTLSDFNAIKQKFEQTGVNLRFMNAVFKHIQRNKRVKYLLLLNMVARALKSDVLHVLRTHDKSSYVRSLNDVEKLVKDKYCLDVNNLWDQLREAGHSLSTLINCVENLSGIQLAVDEHFKSVTIASINHRERKISPPTSLTTKQLEQLVEDVERNSHCAPILSDLKDTLVHAYIAKNKLNRALELSKQVLEHQKMLFGETDVRTFVASHIVAYVNYCQGRYAEAARQYEELLELANKHLSPRHMLFVVILSHLGLIYTEYGKYQQALDYFQKAIIYCREHDVKTNVAITVKNNTAILYKKLGMYDEALELLKEALKDQIEHFGETHPETLGMLSNIGNIHCMLKRYDKALEYCKQAFKQSVRVLGPSNTTTLTTRNNLGNVYERMNKYDKALRHYEAVIQTESRLYDEHHPAPLITKHNYACALSASMKNKEALDILQHVLQAQVKLLGEAHPDTLATRNSMVLVFTRMKRFEEAIEYSKAVIKSCKRTLVAYHPLAVSATGAIAQIYTDTGNFEEALKWCEKTLKLEQSLYGEDSREAMVTIRDIANIKEGFEQYDEAFKLYTIVYDHKKAHLGENHQSTMMALQDVADMCYHLDDLDQALAHYHTVLKFQETTEDSDMKEILITKRSLGNVYTKKEQHEVALGYYEQVLNDDTDLDEEDPETAVMVYNTASILEILKRYEEAIEMYKRAILLQDEEDVATLDALKGLGSVYRKLGRYDEAIDTYNRVLQIQKTVCKEGSIYIHDTEAEIAETLFKKGCLEEALIRYEKVLQRYEEVLGPDDADTIKTRNVIATIKEQLLRTPK